MQIKILQMKVLGLEIWLYLSIIVLSIALNVIVQIAQFVKLDISSSPTLQDKLDVSLVQRDIMEI